MNSNHDLSILAHCPTLQIHPDYDEWLSRITHALGKRVRNAPDLAHLLSWGFETNPHGDYERRQQLFIYLSIEAGSMISGRVENPEAPYWQGRKMIEAEARRALAKDFYGFPTLISNRIRRDSSYISKMLLLGNLGQFLEMISDRDTLRLIFRIFDPQDSAYPKWWVRREDAPIEAKAAAVFIDWLLRIIWSSRGLRRKPELTTWARRETISWVYRTRRFARYMAGMRPEPWMIPYATRHIAGRRLDKRKRAALRVSRTAIRDARDVRFSEASLKKAERRVFRRKSEVAPRKKWRRR